MSLRSKKVNPLNVLELRKVNFPAPYFYYTSIEKINPTFHNTLERWIKKNLNSRYYIGQDLEIRKNVIVYVTKIGFEQEKELSFFNLACPFLN